MSSKFTKEIKKYLTISFRYFRKVSKSNSTSIFAFLQLTLEVLSLLMYVTGNQLSITYCDEVRSTLRDIVSVHVYFVKILPYYGTDSGRPSNIYDRNIVPDSRRWS